MWCSSTRPPRGASRSRPTTRGGARQSRGAAPNAETAACHERVGQRRPDTGPLEGPFVRLNGFAGLDFGVPSSQFPTQAIALEVTPWLGADRGPDAAFAAYHATLARDIEVFAPILPVAIEVCPPVG